VRQTDDGVAMAVDALLGERGTLDRAGRANGRLLIGAWVLSAVPLGITASELSASRPFHHMVMAAWIVLVASGTVCVALAAWAGFSLWSARRIADSSIRQLEP
jgi:hypothetical protein